MIETAPTIPAHIRESLTGCYIVTEITDPAAVAITADNAVRCLNEATGENVLIQPLYSDKDRAKLTAQMKAVSAIAPLTAAAGEAA